MWIFLTILTFFFTLDWGNETRRIDKNISSVMGPDLASKSWRVGRAWLKHRSWLKRPNPQPSANESMKQIEIPHFHHFLIRLRLGWRSFNGVIWPAGRCHYWPFSFLHWLNGAGEIAATFFPDRTKTHLLGHRALRIFRSQISVRES